MLDPDAEFTVMVTDRASIAGDCNELLDDGDSQWLDVNNDPVGEFEPGDDRLTDETCAMYARDLQHQYELECLPFDGPLRPAHRLLERLGYRLVDVSHLK